jgi:predicted Ser/Thr protein kinase
MPVLTVGRYEITGELGRGAMGVVYKAQDPTIGRTVALKTMRLDVHGLETDEVLRRFKNEARAAGLLNHPNIVTIYDAGEQDGMFYIAMEFIEGTTLQALLAENHPLSPEETLQISRQICKGLDYAHANGTIHRDIKPANIMIAADGTVKIMDFGIAKAGGGLTNTGQVLGTPNYMSPEQVMGKAVDGRSDLFSFGVVLYEMVTAEKPFAGDSITTIIYKIIHEDPVPPRDLDVTVHPGLSAVITKALSKSPDGRYQTGAELVKDLENYKAIGSNLNPTSVLPTAAMNRSQATQLLSPAEGRTAATNAHKATVVPPATAIAPRKRSTLALVLVSVLLVLAAIGGYLFYLFRATRNLQAADQALEQKIDQQQRDEAASVKPAENKPQAGVKPSPVTDLNSNPQPAAVSVSPSPSLAVSQGELRLDSQPRGAKVSVDGLTEPAAVTPFSAPNLSPGKHNLIFSVAGYTSEARTVTVEAGKSLPVSVELLPVPSPDIAIPEGKGMVRIHTVPEGATIQIDNRTAPRKTNVAWPADPGTYDIVLTLDGYKAVHRTVRVQLGREVLVDEILEKRP